MRRPRSIHTRDVARIRARNRTAEFVALIAVAFTMAMTITPTAAAVDFVPNQAAERVLGAPSFTSESMNADANMRYGMGEPRGVVVDTGGSVFVSDLRGNRIMRWASVPGSDGADVDNVAQSMSDTRLAFRAGCGGGIDGAARMSVVGDGAGQKLVVADEYNHRVLVFTAEPTADTAKANYFMGQTNGSSCNPNRGGATSATTLNAPTGVWTDGTKLAIADSENNRVLLWNAFPANGNTPADVVVGQPDFTSSAEDRGGSVAQNSLDKPQGVFFDGNYLYIADTENHRVMVWSGWPAANGTNANYVFGQANFLTSTAPPLCTADTFAAPTDVTARLTGSGHRIAINSSWNSRVLIFNNWPSAPISQPVAANAIGQTNTTTCLTNHNTSPAPANGLRRPDAMSFDSLDRLWIADFYNHRVVRIDDVNVADPSAALVLGHRGATSKNASTPFDINDNAYFDYRADTQGTLDFAGAVAISPSGSLFMTSQAADTTSMWTSAPAADNELPTYRLGQTHMHNSGDAGPRSSTTSVNQCDPSGVWTDGTKLLVADRCNHRVLAWTSMPTASGQAADFVIGQANMSGSTGSTSATRMHNPRDVVSDGTDIYVADSVNDRILIFRNFWSSPANGKAADFVIGQADFTSNSNGLSSTRLYLPTGIDLDAAGRLAVSDHGNNRILVYLNADGIASNGVAADAVVGQANYTSNGSGTTTNLARDVALAGNALIYTQSSRAYVLDPLPTSGPNTAASAQMIGIGSTSTVFSAQNYSRPLGIDAANGEVWLQSATHARALRFDDDTNPTITVAPAVTARCDGTATVTWTTSESTSTEIGWDTVSRSWGSYANSFIDPTMSNPSHSYELNFATPGTKYVRVRAADWDSGNTPVVSSEVSFVIPATCPAPTTMLGDDTNAQTGRANPSATNAPPIRSSTFHTSWLNGSGVTMDRFETATWTSPPEHARGLWRLDGSTAADANSQVSNAITWSGAPAYTGGNFGQGISLNGTSQYGTIAHDPTLNQANDFTVDAWFRTTDISGSAVRVLLQKGGPTGCLAGCNYSIEARTGPDRINATLYSNGGQRNASTPLTGFMDGQWHHVAMTYDSTNTLRLYLDGVLRTTTVVGTAAETSTEALQIGSQTGGTGAYWKGDVDEVRFAPTTYDDAAIRGYYRTRRPHATALGAVNSTAFAAACLNAARCEDQVYAGSADVLRPEARYYQRTRHNTLNNDYWTNWGVDWIETDPTTSITVTSGATMALGAAPVTTDAFGSATIDVTTNAGGGYQLLARDESDTWGLEELGAIDTLADRQDGATAPATWASGVPGYFGVTVRNASGGRLAKWGPGTGWPQSDVANNLYTGLEATSDVVIHQRSGYSLATDTITLTARANAATTTRAGNYDGTLFFTAVANP